MDINYLTLNLRQTIAQTIIIIIPLCRAFEKDFNDIYKISKKWPSINNIIYQILKIIIFKKLF